MFREVIGEEERWSCFLHQFWNWMYEGLLQEKPLRMMRGKKPGPVLARTSQKAQLMGQRSFLQTGSGTTQAHSNGTHGCAGRTTTRDDSWNSGDKLWHGRWRNHLEWEPFPAWLQETHLNTHDGNVERTWVRVVTLHRVVHANRMTEKSKHNQSLGWGNWRSVALNYIGIAWQEKKASRKLTILQRNDNHQISTNLVHRKVGQTGRALKEQCKHQGLTTITNTSKTKKKNHPRDVENN